MDGLQGSVSGLLSVPSRGQKQDLSHLGPAQCLAHRGQPPEVKSDQGLIPWALVPQDPLQSSAA